MQTNSTWINCLDYSTNRDINNPIIACNNIHQALNEIFAFDTYDTQWTQERLELLGNTSHKKGHYNKNGEGPMGFICLTLKKYSKSGTGYSWGAPDQLAEFETKKDPTMGVGYDYNEGVHFYKVNDEKTADGSSVAGALDGPKGLVKPCVVEGPLKTGVRITQGSSTGESSYLLLGFIG